MRALRIARIERQVSLLGPSVAFYEGALGFTAAQTEADHAVLRRGEQTLVLRGGGAPAGDMAACDQGFQHIALPVGDMAAAVARLMGFSPRLISVGGAQRLPPSSGGVTALKFRDPDGLPVEFLQFPGGRTGGIDHSAIVVADVARSLAFYRDRLGLHVIARQTNSGPAQDRLDGLSGVEVDVVALAPEVGTPHVEFLGYRRPAVRPGGRSMTRFVFEIDGDGARGVLRDPDGHEVVLEDKEERK